MGGASALPDPWANSECADSVGAELRLQGGLTEGSPRPPSGLPCWVKALGSQKVLALLQTFSLGGMRLLPIIA